MDNLSPLNDISSKTFDELFSRFNSLDTNKLFVYLIDTVDVSALPHLAEQFHVTGNEGWLLAGDKAGQRQLIKESIKIHRIKGTKAAVKNVLNSLSLEGNIQEWFEYSGEPYHFKIFIVLKNRAYDAATFDLLKKMIDEYKNVRSVLEEINIESEFTCTPCWLTYLNAENEVIIG